MIELRDLTVRHGARPVLQGVSCSVDPGARLAVLGVSGAGKTTLLRTIAGLLSPTSGQVHLAGRLADDGPGRKLAPRHRQVGMVFQDLALWSHLSVLDTLRFVGATRDDARALAERVQLGDRLQALPAQLSGGERQRLALARALAQRPAHLLLDEPFAHLDVPLRDALIELALSDSDARTTVLVTHHAADVFDLATDVLVLDQGHVVDAGPLPDVLAHPTHRRTVELLGLGAVLPAQPTPDGCQTPLGPCPVDGDSSSFAHLPPTALRVEEDPEGDARVLHRHRGVARVRHPAGILLAPSDLPAGTRVRLSLCGPARWVRG